MKLAIMQPYLFPYLGYYQLISAVDHFVVLDDVTFIKQGWINRNRILSDGGAFTFTVPLRGAGSHVRIDEIAVSAREYPRWRERFLRTLRQNYRKAPHFDAVMSLIDAVFCPPGARILIRDLATESLRVVMRYLGLPFRHSFSSMYAKPDDVRGADRVMFLCHALGASAYYNAPGGRDLYDRRRFAREGIELRFVVPRRIEYPQGRGAHVANLSMLDVLMFNNRAAVRSMLGEYDLE